MSERDRQTDKQTHRQRQTDRRQKESKVDRCFFLLDGSARAGACLHAHTHSVNTKYLRVLASYALRLKGGDGHLSRQMEARADADFRTAFTAGCDACVLL